MKVLIVGGTGMLGHKLLEKLTAEFAVWGTVRANLDKYEKFKIFQSAALFENISVADKDRLCGVLDAVKPDVVINAAGVIKQKAASKDVVQSLEVNSIFPHRLARLTEEFGARLITFGTDCVFSGAEGNYTEEDAPDALDLYGRSKNFGELTEGDCLTLRTSIIGRELLTKHSLAEWFLSNRGGKVKGYARAVFSGFPTVVMAEIVVDIIKNHKNVRGLYHLSAEPINKFDLLGLLKKEYKLDIEIERDESFIIDRSLDSTKFRNETGFRPQSWAEMIERMARDNALYETK